MGRIAVSAATRTFQREPDSSPRRPWKARKTIQGRLASAACTALITCGFPAIAAQDAAAFEFGDRPLRPGSHGGDVRVLQELLTRLGHPTRVDGEFGRRTRRSVRRYERTIGIHVNGRVSRPQARGMLGRAQPTEDSTPVAVPVGLTDGNRAVLSSDARTALAPAAAPQPVKDAIAAANRITGKPYRYGGGHAMFEDAAYDCSGAVSYVLHGAGLLERTRSSSQLAAYGSPGAGEWISVYANGGHAYVVIAGLRFDTSGRGEEGPRWRPGPRSGRGYTVRHPPGL